MYSQSVQLILNHELRNAEYSSKNPESHQRLESRIQVPLTKIGIQYLNSGIRDVESRIQDCRGIPYMGRNSVDTVCMCLKHYKFVLRFLDKL